MVSLGQWHFQGQDKTSHLGLKFRDSENVKTCFWPIWSHKDWIYCPWDKQNLWNKMGSNSTSGNKELWSWRDRKKMRWARIALRVFPGHSTGQEIQVDIGRVCELKRWSWVRWDQCAKSSQDRVQKRRCLSSEEKHQWSKEESPQVFS